MGYFYTLTKAGFALQAKLFAEGGSLVITRVIVGSGMLPEDADPTLLTDLVQARARATSTIPIRHDCVVDFEIEYRSDLNAELKDAFLINEFGAFALGADGTEALILYGDLSKYPETAVPQMYGGCVRRYPVHVEIGPRAGAYLDYPAGAWATYQDLEAQSFDLRQALAAHSADLSAHANRRHVIATRVRDPARPTYGLEPGGGGGAEVLLAAGPYTGTAEVSAIVSGVEYDAENMRVNGENVPDGTLILKKLEDT